MKVLEGKLLGEGFKVGIVASRFNHLLVDKLIEGALDCFLRHGVKEEDIILLKVPGSWEIPLGVKKLLKREDIDGVVALGVLIRGQTPHFEYIANEVAKALSQLSLELEKPITFGIITAETLEQAIERAGTKMGNKGWEGALSLLEMISLLKNV